MAITRAQGKFSQIAGSASTIPVTLTSTVGSGNMLVMEFDWTSGAGDYITGVTDDKSNVYRVLPPTRDATGGYTSQSAYCFNITNSPQTITATLSASSGAFRNVRIDEFTGFASSSLILDGYLVSGPTSVGTGTDAVTVGPITTTANGDLVWANFATRNGAATRTHGTGFTDGTLSGSPNLLTEFQVQTNAGSISATMTTSVSADFYISTVMAFKVQSGAQTYYVSPTGSDSNSGTSSGSPWQTTAKVNGTTFNGGDSVLFQGGQTFSTSNISIGVANWGLLPVPSSSSPVTFGSYGAGQATISSGSSMGFASLNVSGFILRDLVFTAGAGSPTVDGVRVLTNFQSGSRLDYVQLLNLTISAYGLNGINIWGNGGASSGFSNVTISGCVMHDNTGAAAPATAGIRVQGIYPTQTTHTNVYITGCSSYNNTGATGQSNWTGSGIIIEETSGSGLLDVNGNTCGALIDNCVAHDNGANSIGTVGIWFFAVDKGVIQFCESYSNKMTGTTDGDGFDLDAGCTNCVIQYCYSHDNDGAGFQVYQYTDTGLGGSSNNTVRYCISQNDGVNASSLYRACCMIGNDGGASGQTGVKVYNNTFYTSRAGVPAIMLQGTNLADITGNVDNNIFYLGGATNFINFSAAGNPSGLLFNKNDYFTTGSFSLVWNVTTYTTMASWRSATSQETLAAADSSLVSDPKLNNPGGGGTTNGYSPGNLSAYQLQSSSPLIGVGLDLSGLYGIVVGSQDYYGRRMPTVYGTGYSVGAFAAGDPLTLSINFFGSVF